MGRYAGADAPKSLMNLYGGIASVCSFYILFVFPEVWTVIRVISNDNAQLFGADGSIQRSGAEGVRSIKTSLTVTISMAAPFSGAPAAPDRAPAHIRQPDGSTLRGVIRATQNVQTGFRRVLGTAP